MNYFRNFFFLLTIFSYPLFALDRTDFVISEQFISQDGENFDCHGSSLIDVSGVLCAVWKGGPGTGKCNVDMKEKVGLWLSRFENDEWTKPEQIVDAPGSVCWTPTLAKHPSGELLLFYRLGKDPQHAVGLCKRSLDQGLTWSEAEVLPAGILGPIKYKPVFDNAGNMICGSSAEVGAPEDVYKATACWVEILSADGQWSSHGPIEIPGKRFGALEPNLFWGKDGVLKMFCRDRSNKIGLEGWIFEAESKDNGKTWSELKKTAVPNSDSGFDLVSLGDGKMLLFFNNSHLNRYPLTVALSTDYGDSWTPVFDLESESGEFPSTIVDRQGFVHLTYAYMPTGKTQRQIKYMKLNFSKL